MISDLTEAISLVRTHNPAARFVLTVSPVPLIATMEDCSVLVSTTYSKSVLRVAAEEVAAAHDGVSYFPSYEVITGMYTRGAYFAEGLRDVTEAGVQHVVRLFLKHYADFGTAGEAPPEAAVAPKPTDDLHAALEEAAAVLCDEVLLDAPDVSPAPSAGAQRPVPPPIAPPAIPQAVTPAAVSPAQPPAVPPVLPSVAPPSVAPPAVPPVRPAAVAPSPSRAPASAWDVLKPPLPFAAPPPQQASPQPPRRTFLSRFRKDP